jgi:hypothetical protein
MTRYTIDTDDGAYAVEGDGEVSFTCLKEAKAEAHKVLGGMVQDVMPDGEHRLLSARIRDEQGQEVYEVTLTLHGSWKVTPPS